MSNLTRIQIHVLVLINSTKYVQFFETASLYNMMVMTTMIMLLEHSPWSIRNKFRSNAALTKVALRYVMLLTNL